MCKISDKKYLKISKTYMIAWYHLIVTYYVLLNIILPIKYINKFSNTDLNINSTHSEKNKFIFNQFNTYILFFTIITGLSSLAFYGRSDIYNIVMNSSYLFIYSLLSFILNFSFLNDLNRNKSNISSYNEYNDIIDMKKFLNISTFLNIIVPLFCINIYISAIIYLIVKRRASIIISPE